jgi:hypothetical protein
MCNCIMQKQNYEQITDSQIVCRYGSVAPCLFYKLDQSNQEETLYFNAEVKDKYSLQCVLIQILINWIYFILGRNLQYFYANRTH